MDDTEHEHVDLAPGEHVEVEAHEPAHVTPASEAHELGPASDHDAHETPHGPEHVDLVEQPVHPDLAPQPDHKTAMDEVKDTHPKAEHEHLEVASHIVTIPHVKSGNRTLLGAGTTMAAAWHDALRRLRAAL